MPLTQPEATHLATLLADLRPGDWTVQQLMNVLGRHKDHPASLADISTAAINVARNTSLRSPDVIFMPGSHWTPNAAAQAAQEHARRERCPAHPDERTGIANCSGCWSEIKTGDRPRSAYGRIYPPLDGPDPTAA